MKKGEEFDILKRDLKEISENLDMLVEAYKKVKEPVLILFLVDRDPKFISLVSALMIILRNIRVDRTNNFEHPMLMHFHYKLYKYCYYYGRGDHRLKQIIRTVSVNYDVSFNLTSILICNQ